MIAGLTIVVVLAAFAAWLVAAWSMIRLLMLTGNQMTMGWPLTRAYWIRLEKEVGEEGLPHLRRMRRAALVFVAIIFGGFVAGLLQIAVNKSM